MADTDEYIEPGEAARRFGVSRRTVERWAASGKIRTRPNPARRGNLYHARDMERWGLGGVDPTVQTARAAASTELVPQGELLRMLSETQDKLNAAMHEAGRLRGQLEAQQKLLEDREQRQTKAEADAERLRRILARLPWWVRLLWARDT